MLQGVGVSPGVGIGRAVVIAEGSLDYTQVHFAGVQQEKARLRTAVQAFAQRTQAMRTRCARAWTDRRRTSSPARS